MIPKRIFYVYGVADQKKRDVLACIQTWRQICPDYEIIEINENSTEYFDFKKELSKNKWFKCVYERQMWAYVADYIRVKVLYDNGGIYLDTDVSVLKKFDDLLNDSCFVGIQDSKVDGRDDLVEPAILGAEKGNLFLKKICDFYFNEIWETTIYTIPQIFKYFLNKLDCPCFPEKNNQKIINLKEIKIYPEIYFIPFRYKEQYNPECVKKNTYTIHWFGGSWLKPEICYFLKHKHLLKNDPNIKIIHSYRIIKFFNFIPIMKITSCNCNFQKYSLFGIINVYVNKFNNITVISLFRLIRLFKIINKNGNIKTYLFGVIPFLYNKEKSGE